MSNEHSEQDELAVVQDNVSSSMIGEMRMQFWRDAVDSIWKVLVENNSS